MLLTLFLSLNESENLFHASIHGKDFPNMVNARLPKQVVYQVTSSLKADFSDCYDKTSNSYTIPYTQGTHRVLDSLTKGIMEHASWNYIPVKVTVEELDYIDTNANNPIDMDCNTILDFGDLLPEYQDDPNPRTLESQLGDAYSRLKHLINAAKHTNATGLVLYTS